MKKNILITGGAGFIGSYLVRLFVNKYEEYTIYNLDNLTYAGNLENLRDIESKENYKFIKADVANAAQINEFFEKYKFDSVIYLAAESHADRSIENPMEFVMTNVVGTVNLSNPTKSLWNGNFENKLFYHVSTDEVYGSLDATGLFTETTSYVPNSPYSASKASSDHFVRAYDETYGMPFIISNCSNNYGPNHFPEKLMPLFINNIIQSKAVPVYGDGNYRRDWSCLKDHSVAIDTAFHNVKKGDTYYIGGFNEWKNIDLVKLLCTQMDTELGRVKGESEKLISYVKDRPGHDLRYAIDASKVKRELGWMPSVTFEEGLKETINWYLDNTEWLKNVTSGKYQESYTEQYP